MKGLLSIVGGFSLVAIASVAFAKNESNGNNSIRLIDAVDDLPRHPSKRYKSRSLSQIRYIVIHHSAGDNQGPELIARFHSTSDHLQKGGAPGIAYHFYITEDGTVYKTNRLETISWHVSNNNTASVGICMSGNLNNHPPTEAQKRSVSMIAKRLKQTLPNQVEIKRHGFFKSTSCPGKFLNMEIFN